MLSFLKRKDTRMTDGSITRHLVQFAVPLFIGFVFQQLYNTVDSIVVGNFVGKEALAAVGSVSSIINTLIGFFLGLSSGASVILSQYYGAGDDEKVKDAVHTTIILTFIMSAVSTLIGVVMVPFMLRFMSTPADVFDEAAQYLRIYFYGVAGLLIYNMGSGILRAVGDSSRPLYFLVFSAVVNTVLDLVFVVYFGWGVAGVAIATVIAQCLSALLILVVLTRSKASYGIRWGKMRINGEMMKKIWIIGLPSALQQAITSFSNVFVQSYVNRFGSACMAGWATYGKIDQFALIPMQSLSMSATTFVGQNIGANDIKRAKKGTTVALIISLLVTGLIIIPLMVFSKQLISMFNTDPDVLKYGQLFIRLCSPFYLLCVINQIYASTLRGAGDTKAPMYIMLLCFVVFRQIYLYLVTEFIGTIIPVAFGYPVGWLLCSIIIYAYYRKGKWEKKRIVSDEHNTEPEPQKSC